MRFSTDLDDYLISCGRHGLPLDKCLVIDAHAHLGPLCDFPHVDGSVAGVIDVMDRIGIDRLYASGGPGLYGNAVLGNDIILMAMRKYPARVFGYMTTDVGYAETIQPELERCFAEGFSGIKIWSKGGRAGYPYCHPNYRIIFAFAQKHALPILAHTWNDELDQLDEAFKKYDGIKWLLAHSGASHVEKYIKIANTYENVYLETCLSACPKGLIEYFVKNVPLEKIIWGTDQTFMSATHQIGRVLFADISEDQKKSILGMNAARVFCC